MIGIPLGLLYANMGEWLIHKHILHGRGQNPQSGWAFHWHEHHRNVRLHGFFDEAYTRPLSGWNGKTKELVGVTGAALLHAPLFPVAPFFTMTLWYSAANYYISHKRAHLDPAWAEKHMPWHVDHHLAADQDCNWGVTRPWCDWIMKTRKPYLGTDRDRKDREAGRGMAGDYPGKPKAEQKIAS